MPLKVGNSSIDLKIDEDQGEELSFSTLRYLPEKEIPILLDRETVEEINKRFNLGVKFPDRVKGSKKFAKTVRAFGRPISTLVKEILLNEQLHKTGELVIKLE